MKKLSDKIVAWIKSYVKNAGANGVVLGLSGGIDSAVVAALCKRALTKNRVYCLSLPCYGSNQDLDDAYWVADSLGLGLRLKVMRLDKSHDCFVELLGHGTNGQSGNVKARLRMVALYDYAAKNNCLVVGTCNRSEIEIGYFTKYGDGASDFEPLGNVLKTDVVKLAKYLKIPMKIIKKQPSAGLWKGQTDEGELGFTYEELDSYIKIMYKADHHVRIRKKIGKDKLQKMFDLMESTKHKRCAIPIFKED